MLDYNFIKITEQIIKLQNILIKHGKTTILLFPKIFVIKLGNILIKIHFSIILHKFLKSFYIFKNSIATTCVTSQLLATYYGNIKP